ncbi:MAG: ATP-dependent 6-phosphofructokinase [Deltaproteobacteria bacterium]|nr:ATP-dependent 6-phosphofructokinase [Deltaproteobacteria bacterium]
MPPKKRKRETAFDIETLGPCRISSPLNRFDHPCSFVSEDDRILLNLYAEDAINRVSDGIEPPSLEHAGPRRKIYFDSAKVKAAIVTCGGLCPGINSVIRAIVMELHYNYGVKNILGIKFGFEGFIPEYGHPVVELTPEAVTNIHGRGGSFLGMSRGAQEIGAIVDALERLNVSVLFAIGGDGTLKASHKIAQEITKRKLKTAIVGIPKTIDNDITLVSKTFGFDSAVEAATDAIESAHNEATSVHNGIGLVKVMGRYAGFVAAHATLALADVNYCLIPEVPFDLEGPKGLLAKLEARLDRRGHAVVLTAEGAGQHLMGGDQAEKDASGNISLKDIGLFLKDRITSHFKSVNKIVTLKYIDPSYMVRSVAASPVDRIFCGFLGQHAVHAGMAGKTGVLVSNWNSAFIHLPFSRCLARQKFVDPKGGLWSSVIEVTGQGTLRNLEEKVC